jgi:hypothetical protein
MPPASILRRTAMIERTLRKLYNNILSPNALSVLGPEQYARLLGTCASRLPAILASRDLRPLDQAMSGKVDQISYRGIKFRLDLRFCDEHVRDGSFAFGGVREIYIRDCYLKFHEPSVFTSARIVVDLGANRGIFSTLMAATADFVLCVEALPQLAPVIRQNMAVNGFRNYGIESALIGAGGAIGGNASRFLTLEELFERHGLRQVNLLKMDIEGSEFSLFASEKWLDCVDSISMEVHRSHGDVDFVLDRLRSHDFDISMADENLKRVNDPTAADFIFASKRHGPAG